MIKITRIIIVAAGKANRWNNYLGVAKHFIEIDGEPIIYRLVRLLRERNENDIHVVGLTKDYEIEGSKLYIPNINYKENADADKFLSSKELWSKDERTIVFYGDCYFTEKAIDTILNYQPKEWTLFCRPGKSMITGHKWGECFAQSFYPEHLEKHEENLHQIANLWKRGKIKRCGGWEHYRAMVGLNLTKHRMSTNYIEINDFTEDFDSANDYDLWIARYKKAKPSEVFHNLPEHKKVLHIGGYIGIEAPFYNDVTFVEPMPQYADYLRSNGFKVIEGAVGGKELYITSYDQASSILKPKQHKIREKIEVKEYQLSDIEEDFDMLVMDTQGSELQILKSGTLDNFKHIVLEASTNPRYENAGSKEEIENYLKNKWFEKINEFQHGKHDIYDLVFRRKK